jgi:exopolysaccharide production protein ExoQ
VSSEFEFAGVDEGTASSPLAFAVGFYLSLRWVFTLFFVRVLGTEPRMGPVASLVVGVLLLGLVSFASLGEPRVWRWKRITPLWWVLLFLAVSACSFAWTESVDHISSFAYWLGMVSDVATVVLLLQGRPVVTAAHSLMKGFIWSSCFLAFVAWLMPLQQDLRLGDYDYFNTNQIGTLCAFSILLAQYLMRRKDGRWAWVVTFLAVTLLRSLSKTTIVAFVICEAFLLIQDRSVSRRTKVLLTTAVIATVFVFWGLFEAYFDIYSSAGNQAETLTGRLGIWAWVANEVTEKPWFGHGFDSLWKVMPPFGADQFEARHAENELLQQIYAYGVLGVVMLAGLYTSFYRKIRRLARGPVRVALTSLLLFVLVRGLAEAEPFDLLLPLWAIVLFSVLIESMEYGDEPVMARATVNPRVTGARASEATTS